MFLKLLLIILATGAIASCLLVLRQQKVETIHEISRSYQRARENEQTLWKLQAEIARRSRPQALRQQLEVFDQEWRPIPAAPIKASNHNMLTVFENSAPNELER